jgi:hypothetical protein
MPDFFFKMLWNEQQLLLPITVCLSVKDPLSQGNTICALEEKRRERNGCVKNQTNRRHTHKNVTLTMENVEGFFLVYAQISC